MPMSIPRFFLVNTCLNLVTRMFHGSGAEFVLSIVNGNPSVPVGGQVPHSPSFIQAGMIPKQLDFSSQDGYSEPT